MPVPKSILAKETPEKSKEISRKIDEGVILRENQATVYMTIQTMVSLHSWLGRKIDEFTEIEILERKKEEKVNEPE